MAQPDLIPMPFAENATPGTIEPIPATTPTVPQDATWSAGFPQVTMQPLASGGIPPRGQNFNGVLNVLSQHIFHMQGGGQYKWDDAHGPYSIGDVLQSDDGLSTYISAVDNNTVNFNTTPSAIGNQWIPAGGASKANSSLTISAGAGLGGGGNLSANRTLFADFASEEQAQELLISNKVISPLNLGQAMNAHVLGMGQTWEDVTGQRALGVTYTNTTGRPIYIAVSFSSRQNTDEWIAINGVNIVRSVVFSGSAIKNSLSAIIPAGATYSCSGAGFQKWSELR